MLTYQKIYDYAVMCEFKNFDQAIHNLVKQGFNDGSMTKSEYEKALKIIELKH